MGSQRTLLRAGALLSAGVIGLAANAGVVFNDFSDGEFLDTDWINVTQTINGGSVTLSRLTTGGNPDAHKRVQISTGSAPAGQRSIVFSVHLMSGFTHDPGVDGEVLHLEYTEDFRRVTGNSIGQTYGVAVRQGGHIFVTPGVMTGSQSSWTTRALTTFTADDFARIDLTDLIDGLDEASKPDFSASGGAIEFGFFRANQTNISGFAITTTQGIDNWNLRIAALIPAPGSAALALCAGGLMAARQRRR